MIAQIRAELLRQRTTRTPLGVLLTMLGLVGLAVALHALGLPVDSLAPRHNQLMVVGVGERLGVLFAALFGAMIVTVEFRHGTIRPTLLVAPRRWRVLAAKVVVGGAAGAGLGFIGSLFGVVLANYLLAARGVSLGLTSGDYAALILGAGVAGGLWAVIGVGVGSVVRNQVPVLIGLSAWLLFVEGLLVEENSSVINIGKMGPGAAATAIAGMGGDSLLVPAVAVIVLASYAAVFWAAGWLAFTRVDVS